MGSGGMRTGQEELPTCPICIASLRKGWGEVVHNADTQIRARIVSVDHTVAVELLDKSLIRLRDIRQSENASNPPYSHRLSMRFYDRDKKQRATINRHNLYSIAHEPT